ncbi:unnamed protein product [Didymodactylos carnosus]|uniref:Uncharacterized protein n=1 Tax=Didymodactylos carnosus TaxID=1234261 RepID=A0A8S2X1H4_9BILA|nr:unnamed protein product [Didymodactylos carnosus]CAF3662128.1 unnamed protein product [Didymodactylos carnosus]CAF4470811.1 unnamed protein product [Didymodactylos carnosus]
MDEREDKKDICRFFNVNQFTKTEEKESDAETIQELTSNHTTKTAVDESSVIRNTVQRVYSIINSGKHLLLSLIIVRDCYFKPVLEDEKQVMIGIAQQIVEEVGIEIARKVLEKTYIKWNHILPSKKSMIEAGWFYSGKKDLVICIYCAKKEKCALDNDDCFRSRQVTELKSKGYSLDGGA